MGSRPSSPYMANMEDHPFDDTSLPFEEDVRAAQPLHIPSLSYISTSFSKTTISTLPNPYHVVYDYAPAYDNPYHPICHLPTLIFHLILLLLF